MLTITIIKFGLRFGKKSSKNFFKSLRNFTKPCKGSCNSVVMLGEWLELLYDGGDGAKGVIPTTSVSRPQLKSNPMGDRVMRNSSQGKKQEVEDHRRSVKLSKNKTSVTACNDSLIAKTLNVNYVSAMKHYKALSIDELRLPDFDLISDQEEYSKEEVTETITKTMEQYMSKTLSDYGLGVARPKIEDKDNFEPKGQFLK
nr:hypothetical protein [Tanacetum cinerariifolium]